MTTRRADRPTLAALYVGLALTVVTAVVPFVDHFAGNMLAAHIRAGYPEYSDARIATAATTYLVILTSIGVIGTACWIVSIWATGRGKWWAPWIAAAILILAAIVAATGLLIRDTSGDTGLPPLLGWVGVLPVIAGAVAVTLLFVNPADRRMTTG